MEFDKDGSGFDEQGNPVHDMVHRGSIRIMNDTNFEVRITEPSSYVTGKIIDKHEKIKIPFAWQDLTGNFDSDDTHRAKVIGGWLIKITSTSISSRPSTIILHFISDPFHQWEV